MKSILHEPLVQFLALGGLLFIVFGLLGKAAPTAPPPKITVSPERIDQIVKFFTIDYKHAPTTQETTKAIEDYIHEEILFRQAKSEQLDLEDTVIRSRLKTKMDALNADRAGIPAATDAELETFLKDHPAMFKRGDQLPSLEEARPRVEAAWMAVKRKEASDAAYEKLKSGYVIEIQHPAPTTQEATTQP